jgi:hypothetical protein
MLLFYLTYKPYFGNERTLTESIELETIPEKNYYNHLLKSGKPDFRIRWHPR